MKEIENLVEIIDQELDEINRDVRFHYEPARVNCNVTLALIQVVLGAKVIAFQQIRKEIEQRFSIPKRDLVISGPKQ